MPNSDAFALTRLGLNDFLFASVGTEANGMTLSLVSVFARLGDDPWREAGRLAGLPKLEAIESLARLACRPAPGRCPMRRRSPPAWSGCCRLSHGNRGLVCLHRY
jgi:hypothetical protein